MVSRCTAVENAARPEIRDVTKNVHAQYETHVTYTHAQDSIHVRTPTSYGGSFRKLTLSGEPSREKMHKLR